MTCKPAPPAIAKVICSGNFVLDILVRPIDSFPWGTTTRVESIEQHLGGNGANTSYALAKLGVPVQALGMVGVDAFGETVLAVLASAGVDLSGVARSPAGTATSIGLVNSRGERQFLHRLGASAEVFPNPLHFDGRLAEGFSHYHLASPFALPRLRPHLVETLRNAKEAGLTTSLDTQWDAEGRWLETPLAGGAAARCVTAPFAGGQRVAAWGNPPAPACPLWGKRERGIHAYRMMVECQPATPP